MYKYRPATATEIDSFILGCNGLEFTITLLHYDEHINFQDENVVMMENINDPNRHEERSNIQISGMTIKQNDNTIQIPCEFFELSE